MLLIGGGDSTHSQISTEYVKSPHRQDVSLLASSSLSLEYAANYACAIQLQDDIVLTGLLDSTGIDEYIKVVKYRTNGISVEFPDLKHKRTKHGCSSYNEGDNKVVKK